MPDAEKPIEWDESTFEAALKRLAAEGVIDARGVRLDSERLGQLLAAAPEDPQRPGRRQLRDAGFDAATFTGEADFDGATFSGHAGFLAARFSGRADFARATFEGDAAFDGATFSGDADFEAATFSRDAVFHDATFSGRAVFDSATFSHADFMLATFSSYIAFEGASFEGNACFDGATFEQARLLGPLLVSEELTLIAVVFAQPVRIEVSARRALIAGAVFRAGADLFVRCAEVALDSTDFAGPSLMGELAATELPETLRRKERVLGWEQPVPRLLSVRHAKAAQLTLSGLDLRACHFAGAHGLDVLRIERTHFAQPPSGWRLRGRQPRWTRRQTIAEEHHWRARHGHGPGWYASEVRAPDWLEQESEALDAEQVAGIYRALRKGREDSKDEPGAADFYYGEMEMRRQRAARPGDRNERVGARPVSWAERSILWMYWLVAGYGLRASRALVALAITIALLGAVSLDLWGFLPDRSYGWALLFALESSIGLLRPPGAKLTAGGEVLQIVLRLAGPLLFGLALLSLRGRVKR